MGLLKWLGFKTYGIKMVRKNEERWLTNSKTIVELNSRRAAAETIRYLRKHCPEYDYWMLTVEEFDC